MTTKRRATSAFLTSGRPEDLYSTLRQHGPRIFTNRRVVERVEAWWHTVIAADVAGGILNIPSNQRRNDPTAQQAIRALRGIGPALVPQAKRGRPRKASLVLRETWIPAFVADLAGPIRALRTEARAVWGKVPHGHFDKLSIDQARDTLQRFGFDRDMALVLARTRPHSSRILFGRREPHQVAERLATTLLKVLGRSVTMSQVRKATSSSRRRRKS